jgi:hypothetical protein
MIFAVFVLDLHREFDGELASHRVKMAKHLLHFMQDVGQWPMRRDAGRPLRSLSRRAEIIAAYRAAILLEFGLDGQHVRFDDGLCFSGDGDRLAIGGQQFVGAGKEATSRPAVWVWSGLKDAWKKPLAGPIELPMPRDKIKNAALENLVFAGKANQPPKSKPSIQ